MNDPFEDMPAVPDEWTPPEPEYPLTRLTETKEVIVHPWMAEFYDVEAKLLFDPTELRCAQHSLKKWIGLRSSNLEKHNVLVSPYLALRDKATGRELINITWSSCALCIRHKNNLINEVVCDNCIIFKVNGYECSAYDGEMDCTVLTPWRIYAMKKDPEPMITLLEECVSHLLAESDKHE